MIFLEALKAKTDDLMSYAANTLHTCDTIYLATAPLEKSEQVVRQRFQELNESEKNGVYGKVWELAKMEDPTISGEDWGKNHAFDSIDRLCKALHRLGCFEKNNLHPLKCLPFGFGEGGIGSQYYSLSEKMGKDPITGHIGYVNGMGNTTIGHSGKDASTLSELFAAGNNLHCVYHSTHQKSAQGDFNGFLGDAMRMKAVNGGSYTKTSYLIAQQWVDFLIANPDRKFLQIAHSEGAVHVNAALRIIDEACPELLSRIRAINLCPAYFILPEQYSNQNFQVLNLFKKEDGTINPWGTNTHKIDTHKNILVVPHKADHPHNHLSQDFQDVGKPYVFEFMKSGNLY